MKKREKEEQGTASLFVADSGRVSSSPLFTLMASVICSLDFEAIGSSCRSPSWQARFYCGFHLPVFLSTCVDACCFCFHKQNSNVPWENTFSLLMKLLENRWAPKIRCDCLELFVPHETDKKLKWRHSIFLCHCGPANRLTVMPK